MKYFYIITVQEPIPNSNGWKMCTRAAIIELDKRTTASQKYVTVFEDVKKVNNLKDPSTIYYSIEEEK